ncbi:MAG: hypothetical protein UIM53_05950 [Acutalibacteraceae bacterium]|nr:hypothetical protein [Acutalibacteraceae bacterium]
MESNKIELDLTHLPRDSKGILWSKCVGELIPFIYNNEVDYIKIVGYCKQQVTLELNGRVRKFHIRDVYYNHIEPLLGVYTQKYLFSVGDIIRNYKIIEQTFLIEETENTANNLLRGQQERKYRGYIVECLNCGEKIEVKQRDLIKEKPNIKCKCRR